jgi:integrase
VSSWEGSQTMTATIEHHVAAYLKERQDVGRMIRKTASMQRGVLYKFAESAACAPNKIRRRHILRWLGTTTGLAANTRRLYYGIVRGFTQWLQRRGVLAKDPFMDVEPPRTTKPIHRALDREQVQRLYAACPDDRARAILTLGLHAGLRRAEIASLEAGDVSIPARTVAVRHGKGGKGRLVPLSPEAVRELGRYMGTNAITEGPLLRSHRSPMLGIHPATVGAVMRALALDCGVKVRPRDGVGVHSLRHTCATESYRSTRDVMSVQGLLGHSQLSTTARYVVGLDVEGLRAAVADLHWLAA